MRLTCDLHTHSWYSFDGSESLSALCRSAVDRKIDVIATTDHCDMMPGPEGIASYLEAEEKRWEEYSKVRAAYPELEVLYGIEIGNAIDCPKRTEQFMESRTFDFVIGAIHFLPDGSDIYVLPYNNAEEIDSMFRQYFESMLKLVQLGGFDSLAHLDYPLRKLQGKIKAPTVEQYRDLIEPILETLVQKEIALELNTRGAYDWQGRVGPEDWVLSRYKELGGKYITIGSDSHCSAKIGEGFYEAAEALLRNGFTSYTIYRNRTPIEIPVQIGKETPVKTTQTCHACCG